MLSCLSWELLIGVISPSVQNALDLVTETEDAAAQLRLYPLLVHDLRIDNVHR